MSWTIELPLLTINKEYQYLSSLLNKIFSYLAQFTTMNGYYPNLSQVYTKKNIFKNKILLSTGFQFKVDDHCAKFL